LASHMMPWRRKQVRKGPTWRNSGRLRPWYRSHPGPLGNGVSMERRAFPKRCRQLWEREGTPFQRCPVLRIACWGAATRTRILPTPSRTDPTLSRTKPGNHCIGPTIRGTDPTPTGIDPGNYCIVLTPSGIDPAIGRDDLTMSRIDASLDWELPIPTGNCPYSGSHPCHSALVRCDQLRRRCDSSRDRSHKLRGRCDPE
jgi:hypothetical protein